MCDEASRGLIRTLCPTEFLNRIKWSRWSVDGAGENRNEVAVGLLEADGNYGPPFSAL